VIALSEHQQTDCLSGTPDRLFRRRRHGTSNNAFITAATSLAEGNDSSRRSERQDSAQSRDCCQASTQLFPRARITVTLI